MKTVRFAVPLLVTTFGFAACATAEIYYPWCAVLNAGGAPAYNCGFVSIDQCRATVSGIGGFCEQNPLRRLRKIHPGTNTSDTTKTR